jgi:hypothetical protein
MRAARWLGTLAIAIAIALALATAVDRREPEAPPSDALYTCSMDPSVATDRAGNCPICGMALTKVTAADRMSGAVQVGTEARRRIGIQLAAVESRVRLRHVHATGEVVDAGALAAIEARVYRGDPSDAQPGRTVAVAIPALPLTELSGTIVGAADRVRVEVDNRDQVLVLGMRAELRLDVELAATLVVPAAAVLQAGARRIVFVERGTKLEPRTPKLGAAIDGLVEVREGLTAGDRVVVAGTFLVAAESRTRGGALWSERP